MIRCHLLRLLLLVWMAMGMSVCVFAQDATAQIFRGMTEDEVIETLGEPTSEMGRTGKKMLIYAGGSLELRAKRLYSADGLPMEYMAPDGKSQFAFSSSRGWMLNGQPIDAEFRFTAAPDDLAPPPDTGVKFYRPGEENDPPPTNVVVGTQPPPPPVPAPPPEPEPEAVAPPPPPVPEAMPEAPLALEEDGYYDEETGEFISFDEYDDEYYYDEDYEPSPMSQIIEILIRFIAGFIITIIVLKISFENKGFPVLIPQLLLVSGAQAIVALGVTLGFEAIEFDLWYVQQLIEYLTLAGFIMMFTDVKQAVTAFQISLIARIVTFFLNLGLIFILMLIFFG